jgi:hypothetical protein
MQDLEAPGLDADPLDARRALTRLVPATVVADIERASRGPTAAPFGGAADLGHVGRASIRFGRS